MASTARWRMSRLPTNAAPIGIESGSHKRVGHKGRRMLAQQAGLSHQARRSVKRRPKASRCSGGSASMASDPEFGANAGSSPPAAPALPAGSWPEAGSRPIAHHVQAHHVAEPSQIEFTGASRNRRPMMPSSHIAIYPEHLHGLARQLDGALADPELRCRRHPQLPRRARWGHRRARRSGPGASSKTTLASFSQGQVGQYRTHQRLVHQALAKTSRCRV